jgi:hypothetical protein
MTSSVMLSKIKFSREENNRLAFIFEVDMQIATSEFHSYNQLLSQQVVYRSETVRPSTRAGFN